MHPDAQELLEFLNENREWYKIRSSPSTTTSPKSSPNLAALRRVSLQLESGHGMFISAVVNFLFKEFVESLKICLKRYNLHLNYIIK